MVFDEEFKELFERDFELLEVELHNHAGQYGWRGLAGERDAEKL